MIPVFDKPFVLLADGDWSRLIGIIVIFGFYAIGAVAKMWAKHSSGGEDEDGTKETSQAVELAKKYAKQKQTQRSQPKPTRNNEFMSEWDRRQEIKRQRLAQLHEQGKPVEPVKIPAVPQQRQKPQPAPKQAVQNSEYINVPDFQKAWALNLPKQPGRQKKPIIQPPKLSPTPQTFRAAAKPAKSRSHKKPAVAETPPPTRPLDIFLKDSDALGSAILLKEILDKPIALREEW
ncbi:MAG: hypothetical protein ISS71_01220 [Phycisphaerae bacterium]|nr:hypothetical protein [Phycisphaerae bacterium]